MSIAVGALQKIFAGGIYLPVFLAALIFLIIWKRHSSAYRYFNACAAASLLLFFAASIPDFFVRNFEGGLVYWRMFWIVPLVPVIAAASAEAVCMWKYRMVRIAAAAVLALLLFFGGSFIYTHGGFMAAYNWEKIPTEAADTSEIIEKHAADSGISYKKLAAETSVTDYIRTYDGKIILSYSRQMDTDSERGSKSLEELLDGTRTDVNRLPDLLADAQCNYVAASPGAAVSEILESAGFSRIGGTAGCTVYFSQAATDRYQAGGRKKNIFNAYMRGAEECAWTGSPQTPKVTLQYNRTVLEEGRDYTVEYLSNTDRGTAVVICTGTGNYCGSIRADFSIY
jgi:hypothetical protein